MIRRPLNNGWEFTERFDDSFLRFEGDAAPVRLPHTCRELPLHYADERDYQMVCGYRRTLELPAEWSGKRLFLTLDGAAHQATVFVNGKEAASHFCGYTAFTVELTGLVSCGGTNQIAVRLDSRESLDQPPFGHVIDYMTFGGLYREVWLDVAEQAYIADMFVRTPSMEQALVDLAIEGGGPADAVSLSILDAAGKSVFTGTFGAAERLQALSCPVSNPRPWTPDSPGLYTLEAVLMDAGRRVLDVKRTRFGFRQAEFRPDGFFLNGEKLKLRGLNRHQSYPYVGYAMPASIQRHDAQVLKHELQCNAVRTSHYPQSQAFLDACDELGLIVFTEIPGWQHIGGERWKDAACQNTRDMLLQYRNHPSIVLWGVRINESQDDDGFYERTNAIARELDPSRQTSGVRFLWKSSLLEDVYAFNDFSHAGHNGGLLPKSLISPDKGKGYLISEFNGHMYPTKPFDSPAHRLDHALRHATVLDAVYGREDVAGGFGWCMADYYTHGDFGSGDRICYHGVLDMFRNPKLAAAVYASAGDGAAVLAVGSEMDIGDSPAGSIGDNYIFTNADFVRVWRDDKLLGEFRPAGKRWKSLRHPPIPFNDTVGAAIEEGEGWSHKKAEAIKDSLLAIQRFGVKIPLKYVLKTAWRAVRWRTGPKTFTRLHADYINTWGVDAPVYRFEAVKDGRVAAALTKSSNAALRLEADASRTVLTEGASYDAAAVRVRIVDANGSTAPYAQLPVRFAVSGPLELLGPDAACADGGMCGTYVRTTGAAGTGTLRITTGQTAPLELTFQVRVEDSAHV